MKTRIMDEEKSFSLFQGHSLHLGYFLALSKCRELDSGTMGRGERCVGGSDKATPHPSDTSAIQIPQQQHHRCNCLCVCVYKQVVP